MRPLNHFPLFKSNNIEEAHQLIARHVKPHAIEVAGPESALNVQFDGLTLGSVSLFHVFYGAKVNVNPESEGQSYFIQSTLAGEGEVISRGRRHITHSQDTVVVSPSLPYHMQLQENCSRLAIEVDKNCLQQYLSAALGEPLQDELEFELHSRENQKSWQNTIHYVLQQAQIAPELMGSAAAKKAISDLLLAQLLETQSHNYSEQLKRPGELMLPAHLRRAIDFINANIHQPPTMVELAKHCNTSVRTLQRSFTRCLEQTPVEYIRNQRLEAVHQALQLDYDTENGALTRILLDHGISDFGRFASYYRKKFGCKPSETLRRAH